jgi:hypothetical protein
MKFWRWFVASSLLAVSLNSCGRELLNLNLGKLVDGDLVQISSRGKGNATGFVVTGPDQVCSVLTANYKLLTIKFGNLPIFNGFLIKI